MTESETTAVPDPRRLTMKEIREGVGGFSMDPAVIPDAPLRAFMTGVSGHFKTKDADVHIVSDAMKVFSPKLETPLVLLNNRLEGLKNRNYIYFYPIPNRMVSLQIDLEASLAFLFTRKKINDYHNNKYSRIEDSVEETRRNLGNYYAVIPFLKDGGKIPKYEIEARPEIERIRQEAVARHEPIEDDEMIGGTSDPLEQSILNPEFEVLQSLSGIDCDFVESKIKKIEEEIIKKNLDSLVGEISWGRLEMSEKVAGIMLFIDCANRHILGDFDRLQGNMTHPQLLQALKTAKAYMEKYPKFNTLDKLYDVIVKAVRSNPKEYFQPEKKEAIERDYA